MTIPTDHHHQPMYIYAVATLNTWNHILLFEHVNIYWHVNILTVGKKNKYCYCVTLKNIMHKHRFHSLSGI